MNKFLSGRDYSKAKKIKDIIPDSFYDNLDADLKKSYKCSNYNKRVRLRAVYFDFLKLMIDDCIEHNTKFISPHQIGFSVCIRKQHKLKTKSILKRIDKVYTDVDLIASEGNIYEMVLVAVHLPRKKWNVRIGYHDYKRIMKHVNEGKRYFK